MSNEVSVQRGREGEEVKGDGRGRSAISNTVTANVIGCSTEQLVLHGSDCELSLSP